MCLWFGCYITPVLKVQSIISEPITIFPNYRAIFSCGWKSVCRFREHLFEVCLLVCLLCVCMYVCVCPSVCLCLSGCSVSVSCVCLVCLLSVCRSVVSVCVCVSVSLCVFVGLCVCFYVGGWVVVFQVVDQRILNE